MANATDDSVVNMDSESITSTSESKQLLVFIMCHDDKSEAEAKRLSENMYKGFSKIVRLGQSKFFENQIFQYMAMHRDEWQDYEYIGICPYSWLAKTKKDMSHIRKVLDEDKGETDVFSMLRCRFIKAGFNEELAFVDALTHQHGTSLWYVMSTILHAYGGYSHMAMLDKTMHGFYTNHWIAKKTWMESYVNLYLTAKVMVETPALREIMHEQSWYTGKLLQDHEKLKSIFGKPWYTLHPFLFERLPAMYFHLAGAKIKHVGHTWMFVFRE